MLYSSIIEASEGVSVNKTSTSIEHFFFHYWYFLIKDLRFNRCLSGCHNVLMMSIDLKTIAILNIYEVDYHCIIDRIIKSEAINC